MKSESQEGAEADRRTQHGWFWSDLFGGSLALILALVLLLGQGCDKPPRLAAYASCSARGVNST